MLIWVRTNRHTQGHTEFWLLEGDHTSVWSLWKLLERGQYDLNFCTISAKSLSWLGLATNNQVIMISNVIRQLKQFQTFQDYNENNQKWLSSSCGLLSYVAIDSRAALSSSDTIVTTIILITILTACRLIRKLIPAKARIKPWKTRSKSLITIRLDEEQQVAQVPESRFLFDSSSLVWRKVWWVLQER